MGRRDDPGGAGATEICHPRGKLNGIDSHVSASSHPPPRKATLTWAQYTPAARPATPRADADFYWNTGAAPMSGQNEILAPGALTATRRSSG